LREARQELKSVKEENDALRYQLYLREDDFHTEEKERKQAQAELQSTRAQLQQLQRHIGERQVCVIDLHHHNNRLMTLYPEQPGWAGTRMSAVTDKLVDLEIVKVGAGRTSLNDW